MSVRKRFSSFREGSFKDLTSHFKSSRPNSHTKWRFREGFSGKIWALQYDNGEEVALLYTEKDTVRFKDFASEVRGNMDIDSLLDESAVILDLTETSLERIVHTILNKTLDILDAPLAYEEAMSTLFLPESGNILAKTIQGTIGFDGTILENDQSWLITMATLTNIPRRAVGIVRLKQPENLGPGHEETRYIIMVLCPSKEKETKSATETSRTFATLFADINFRTKLQNVASENMFKDMIAGHARELVNNQTHSMENGSDVAPDKHWYHLGQGMYEDLKQRIPYYLSDFYDGFFGERTMQKTISATIFLYFACILPAIAFGVLNSQNTGGKLGVMGAILGQTMGGIIFSLLAGQPLIVIMTTAPIALYIKIIVAVADEHDMDFYALYTSVGLWNAVYVILYAITNATKLMRYSTRSTEEIFALFICIAFTVDAVKDAYKDFRKNYMTEACANFDKLVASNITMNSTAIPVCHRENSLLFLLLMLGTLWLATTLYNFNQTPYLQASKREMMADYALPVAVITFSFIGSYLFSEVSLDQFYAREVHQVFHLPDTSNFSLKVILAGMMLGFPLSLLFFMDQNIAESMVNSPDNKLVKGTSYHWDMMVVGCLNVLLSIFCLPWMHAVLPHSPLHVRALADIDEHVEEGHVYDIIVKVRETRISNLVSNVLIGVSVNLIPRPLNYIPIPVLDGLFLYLAVTAVSGNQLFERITLMFMEQTAYPPNHYIRRVPQRKIHQFTACQVAQLVLLCVLGFWPWPYIKMIFPLMLFSFLPIRMLLIPKFIERKYLQVLDGVHP